MTHIILKWIIIGFSVFNFSYMAYDGIRAMTKGDYIRPKTGPYAGQLGPWSNLVRSVGINPESKLMKLLFVIWGLVGLTMALCFAFDSNRAWYGLLIVSISALWYLIPGTVLNILQIVLLIILKMTT